MATGSSRSQERPQTTNLACTNYMQTYVIMKPTGTDAFGTNNAYRDVLFRCGATLAGHASIYGSTRKASSSLVSFSMRPFPVACTNLTHACPRGSRNLRDIV